MRGVRGPCLSYIEIVTKGAMGQISWAGFVAQT